MSPLRYGWLKERWLVKRSKALGKKSERSALATADLSVNEHASPQREARTIAVQPLALPTLPGEFSELKCRTARRPL